MTCEVVPVNKPTFNSLIYYTKLLSVKYTFCNYLKHSMTAQLSESLQNHNMTSPFIDSHSVSSVRDLRINQGIISPLFGHQLVVCALFRHLAILDDCYHVSALDGGQTVGDDNTGPAETGIIQSLLYNLGRERERERERERKREKERERAREREKEPERESKRER